MRFPDSSYRVLWWWFCGLLVSIKTPFESR